MARFVKQVGRLPVHGLGIVRLRKIGKRGLAVAACGVDSSLPGSGAEATAVLTLPRPPGISVAREASGLRRVYRRFLISDLRAD